VRQEGNGRPAWIRVGLDGSLLNGAPACFAQLMVDPAGMLDASFRSSYGVYKIQSFGQSGYHIIWQRDPGVSVDTD
jgi:hypothetical protein